MNQLKNLSGQSDPLFDSVHSQQISITHSLEARNPEQESFFRTPTPPAKANARKILATQIKSVGTDSNANLKGLTTIFFKMIFEKKKNGQLLNALKYALSKKQVNLELVKNKPQRSIGSDQMKKVLNDFFEIMQAKSQEHFQQNQIGFSLQIKQQKGLVIQTISHHPIILEIMTLFFRVLLLTHNAVKNSENYQLPVPTEQSFYIICELFDVNCRLFGQFFQFLEDGLFICSHDGTEYVFGNFYINQGELRKAQPDLTLSTLKYLQNRSQIQNSKRSLPLQESRNSNISNSSENGESILFSRQQTPFFKSDEKTPCFGKQEDDDISLNFKRRKQPELTINLVNQVGQANQNNSLLYVSDKQRKMSGDSKVKQQSKNNKYLEATSRIQKVFGIVSIIQSQQEFSRSNNKQSSVLNQENECQIKQIQSPVDVLESNPISPTTWSIFTNKIKQLQKSQDQNRGTPTRNSNKDSLCLPRTLNQIERRSSKQKSINIFRQKKQRELSASHSNNNSHSNNPGTQNSNSKYRDQFFSSRLDECYAKRVQTEEQEKQQGKHLLNKSKSHKSAYNFKNQKDLASNLKHVAKSLNYSQNKRSEYFIYNPANKKRYNGLSFTKSKKKFEMLNCQCRQIKKERIELKSNIFAVQIKPTEPEFRRPSYYDFQVRNSIKNANSGMNSSKQGDLNNLISSPMNFKKKNQIAAGSLVQPNLNMHQPELQQTQNIQPSIATNRKSQTLALQGGSSTKQKNQFQKDSQELNRLVTPTSPTSPKDNQIQKQSNNQFYKIFGNRKGKNETMLHSSTQFQSHLLNAEEIGHYSSNSNLETNFLHFNKKKSDQHIRFLRQKNPSMRQPNAVVQKDINNAPQNKFKSRFISSTTNVNRMMFMESRDLNTPEANNKVLTRPAVSLGSKQRKFSYNVFSPRKQANEELFSSEAMKCKLRKQRANISDRDAQPISKFEAPRPKAYILNKH